MARKLRVEIDGDSKSGRDALEGVATESEVTAKAVDDLADQFREASRAGSRLDKQLGELRRDLAKTAAEFEKTGDAATLKKLELGTAELAKQQSFRKKLVGLSEEHEKSTSRLAKDLKEIATTAPSGLLSQLEGLSGLSGVGGLLGTGALIAGGIGAAVPALAAGGGAVLAGGAFGAVGAGFAGAATGSGGETVVTGFNDQLDKLERRFHDATVSWVAPTLSAINDVGAAFKDLPIESVFAASEGYIEPLSKGLSGFLVNTAGGLDDLVRSAGPVVDMLEKKLPELGSDFGDSLRIIGTGAPGAAAALGDVLDVVGGLTKAFAGAAAGAGMLYEKALNTPVLREGHQLFEKLFDFKDLPMSAGKALHAVGDEAYSYADAAKAAKKAQDALNEAFRHQFGVAVDSVTANSNLQAAQDKLNEGWHRGKAALDASNDSGRDNIQLALDYVRGAEEVRAAAIAAGDGSALAAAKANEAYRQTLGGLEANLVKLGLSKEAAHAFLVEFLKIDGTTVSTSIVTRHIDQFLPQGISLGNLTHHAAGGVMDTSGFKLVGEKGPEIIFGNKGQFVSTAEQTKRLVSQMSGGGASGSGQASGQLTLVAGSAYASNPLVQLMMEALRNGQLQMFDSTGAQIRARP